MSKTFIHDLNDDLLEFDVSSSDEEPEYIINDMSRDIKTRLESLHQFYNNMGYDETQEFINKQSMMYQFSNTHLLKEYLQQIILNSLLPLQLKIIAAKSLCMVKDKNDVGELLHRTEPEDLIKFGLIPEFVGRLPVVATLQELDQDALVKILLEPKNALTKQYKKLFDMEGVELDFRDDAIKEIAIRAIERKTGARGLRTILEKVLLSTMYDLPSNKNAKKVVLDAAVVSGDNEPYVIYETDDRDDTEAEVKKVASN